MATKDQFLLPALAPINFSLTEGTNIPSPPESPPDTPRPPTPGGGPLSSHPASPTRGNETSSPKAPSANGIESALNALEKKVTPDGSSSSPEDKPLSPAPSKRPSSVRRIFGIRRLGSSDSLNSSRPASPAMSTHMTYTSSISETLNGSNSPGLSRKKSTSWFGRRKSMFGKEQKFTQPVEAESEVQKGPPPPTIPEFGTLGSGLDGGDLGADDLFKNIK